MNIGDVRMVVDQSGEIYFVRLTPLERPRGGVSADMKALVFETQRGTWVGSTPVFGHVHLWTLTDADLQRFVRRVLTNS